MKSPALATLACAALSLARPAGAAHADPAPLPVVVVSASSLEHTVKDAPASVSVITRADLEKRPVLELADMLGSIEGVSLSRNGNQVAGVQLRGLGQAYTLFLVDGKRVNSSNVSFRGNDFDTGWVPTADIERIEVVRGPMSSLYGSDAIGGVVNIITRKIGKTWRGSLKLDTVQPGNDGAGDTRSASVSASGPLIADVLGLRVSSSYDKRKRDAGLNAPVDGVAQPGFPLIANRALGAALAWTPGSGHDVKLGHDTSRRDHGGTVLEREATSLSHRGRYGEARSEATLNLDTTRNLVGTVSGQANPNKARTSSLDGKLILPFDQAGQSVTVGGELRREQLHDPANITGLPGTAGYRQDPNIEIAQYALFAEDEISVRENLKLTLGNRYDHHENFGGHHSPRAYLVYQLTPAITIKGGWARAFRAPTLLQGSANWGSVSCGSATVGCYIIGSPGLSPETSTSKELGMQFDDGRVGGGITLFDNKLSDMIDISSRTSDKALAQTYANFAGFLPDGRPIFTYQNIAKVRTRGVETHVRTEFSRQWSARANLTYTDAKNASNARALPLVYRPRQNANVSVDWRPTAQWSSSFTVRHIGEQYLSVPSNGQNLVRKQAYQVADLSAAYRFGNGATLGAGVLNLADKGRQRDSAADFNEEGRRVFLSMMARF
ncbi:TonB-dependent receptor [Massilia atriviolacea]|uniref:TonB-dependent receptor n=1 Tax=Massilia atriviolacea TaxID=2495579 RepID=A0A430HCT1_9BURK|nr:TonB-dependent receptor [Massilia atriviolacea]RSZ55322.1 TonB-dependent receptor [Massilia atriviolacea]